MSGGWRGGAARGCAARSAAKKIWGHVIQERARGQAGGARRGCAGSGAARSGPDQRESAGRRCVEDRGRARRPRWAQGVPPASRWKPRLGLGAPLSVAGVTGKLGLEGDSVVVKARPEGARARRGHVTKAPCRAPARAPGGAWDGLSPHISTTEGRAQADTDFDLAKPLGWVFGSVVL